MNLEELKALIKTEVKEETKSLVTPDERIQELLAEQSDEFVKGALKEQLEDAKSKLAEMLPTETEEMKVAKEKAKGFKSGSEFLTAVKQARSGRGYDPRLSYLDSKGEVHSAPAEKTAGHMETGDDSQGGFLVPEIYGNDLMMINLEQSIVRARATVIRMTTDSFKFPYVDDTSHASTFFGGVLPAWTAEAAAKGATKPTFGQMELTPQVGAYEKQFSTDNLSNSGKPSSLRDGNPEPSPSIWEGVETGRQASLWDEGTVQTTNTTIH